MKFSTYQFKVFLTIWILGLFSLPVKAQNWVQEPRLLWVIEDSGFNGPFDHFLRWEMLRQEQSWQMMRVAQMEAQAALVESYAQLEAARSHAARDEQKARTIRNNIAALERQKRSLDQRLTQIKARSTLLKKQVRTLNAASADNWSTEASYILRSFAEQVAPSYLRSIKVDEKVRRQDIESERRFFRVQVDGRTKYQSFPPDELSFEGGSIGEYLTFLDRSGHEISIKGMQAIVELMGIVSDAMADKLEQMNDDYQDLSKQDVELIEAIRKLVDSMGA
jgi:chromosome segregation ATPase